MDFNKIIDENIRKFESQAEQYPTLARVAKPIARPSIPIVGRDMQELRSVLRTPEKANVILLGDPGSGKTAFIQGFTYDELSTNYLVLNVDIERLVGKESQNKDTDMANGLLDLVGEVSDYAKKNDIIIVLFIDEFHRIAMVSESAVEALKPILEKSTRNGFRIVAATTFDEYDQWISSNRALDQRLMRMTITELPKDAVLQILRLVATTYNVLDLAEPTVFEDIYDTSRQILISNSQPRASMDMLLNIIGNMTKTEYMQNGELKREFLTTEELNIDSDYPLSRALLNKVVQRSYGIDIDNKADVAQVRNALHAGIFNQEQAVDTVLSLLEMALVGFTDPTRPKSSFLSTGSTGTGKALDDDTEIYVVRNGVEQLMRHGDIQVGDQVYDRLGRLTTVTGVYPQGLKQVYEITFGDGRVVRAADDHLWAVYSHKHKKQKRIANGGRVMTTKDILESGLALTSGVMRYYVPNNRAVQFKEKDFTVHPYVMGVAVGDGCMKELPFMVSSSDMDLVERVRDLLGATEAHCVSGYSWVFRDPNAVSPAKNFIQRKLFSEFPEIYNQGSLTKHIPDEYMYGSVEQRWELVRGLFDTDGSIDNDDYKHAIRFTTISERLAHQVQELLWSLGYSSQIYGYERENRDTCKEYTVKVSVPAEEKSLFFFLERKRQIAYKALDVEKKRVRNYDYIGIRDIKVLDEEVPMTCIMVDNDEHLYQLANGIVTHNTEMAKIISDALCIPLKRFDMSRYSRPEDAVAFADSLAQAAWSAPNAYILIDEVEKSSAEAMNILLQVLDDARLTAANNPNRVISFTGNIINLTTNLGSTVYQHNDRFGDVAERIDTDLIYQALKDSDVFNTAVLGRIDAIVPFQTLPDNVKELIAERELDKNLDVVRTHARTIFVSKDIVPYVVVDRTTNDSESGGARDVKRNLRNIVLTTVASHVANNPNEEIPLIIRLDGVPRHKDSTNNDAFETNVEIVPCHSNDTINNVLAQLSAKVGRQLYNDGLFIEKSKNLQEFANEIVALIRQGHTRFKTDEYDDPMSNRTMQFVVNAE